MQTGLISGLISGSIKVREVINVETATTAVQFDVSDRPSKKYTLISMANLLSSGGVALAFREIPEVGKYGRQIMTGENTSTSALRTTSESQIEWLLATDGANQYGLSTCDITVNDDNVLVDNLWLGGASASSVQYVHQLGGVYDDTFTGIIQLNADTTDNIKVGSMFVLLEYLDVDGMQTGELEPTKIEGAIELVEEVEVSGGATSAINITGLEGDTDKIWLLRTLLKPNTVGALQASANSDTAINYPFQKLFAIGSSPQAVRTGGQGFYLGYNNVANNLCISNCVIFALSGGIRLCLCESSSMNASSVSEVAITGSIWSNTSSEVISLGIVNDNGGTLDNGSKVELYKINDL